MSDSTGPPLRRAWPAAARAAAHSAARVPVYPLKIRCVRIEIAGLPEAFDMGVQMREKQDIVRDRVGG